MAIQKFWLKHEGQIGTAHRSREGAVVDFRPARSPELRAYLDGSAEIFVAPPKGADVQTLTLPAVRTAVEILEEDVLMARHRETWEAEFEGVSFSLTRDTWEQKQTPEAQALRAALAEEDRKQKKATRLAEEEITQRLRGISPQELIELSNPTTREWAKLETSAWETVLHDLGRRVREKFVSERSEANLFFRSCGGFAKESLDRLRPALLAIREEEKARRKAEFLSRKQ